MALVYAIARQESAFDPAAVSSAGALGLLQLMPGTARLVAADMGLAYSQPQLTSDPGYNARLGAAHLRELVNDYGGSYIMTFAGYNAGPGRVREWVARFGDPRDPDIDPIDWIEQISYGETRNYVQRVTENLQVYRDRLGQPTLRIVEDLARGR
jgi:soluble lytic murein transglycosylase